MSVKDLFKGWSDEKKKGFSIVLAGILTIIITVTWFSLNPSFSSVDLGNESQAIDTNYLNDTLSKITEQYNTVIDQISNLTSSTSKTFSSSSIESGTTTQQ